jgi:hypothetical protein
VAAELWRSTAPAGGSAGRCTWATCLLFMPEISDLSTVSLPNLLGGDAWSSSMLCHRISHYPRKRTARLRRFLHGSSERHGSALPSRAHCWRQDSNGEHAIQPLRQRPLISARITLHLLAEPAPMNPGAKAHLVRYTQPRTSGISCIEVT